jgi:hypothetical protein
VPKAKLLSNLALLFYFKDENNVLRRIELDTLPTNIKNYFFYTTSYIERMDLVRLLCINQFS